MIIDKQFSSVNKARILPPLGSPLSLRQYIIGAVERVSQIYHNIWHSEQDKWNQSTTVVLVLQTYLFASYIPITLETKHTSTSIHNANAYEVSSDTDKCFTFHNHICSLTFMITYVFLHWHTSLCLQMPTQL